MTIQVKWNEHIVYETPSLDVAVRWMEKYRVEIIDICNKGNGRNMILMFEVVRPN